MQTAMEMETESREEVLRKTVIPEIALNNGVKMPQLGYGLYEIRDPEFCETCVKSAIECGYRLFDTASAYFNEAALGSACREKIQDGTVKRGELFLTTKVWLQDYGMQETLDSVKRSMEKLGVDYLDLVLLHQPFGNWKKAWKSLEEMYREGMIRAIGTSNFNSERMDELLQFAEVVPQVNQIEMHPFFAETDYAAALRRQKIQPEAWGPLCEGLKGIFTNPVLTEIGSRYGKSAAQTAIRWNLQRGCIVIPKGTSKDHMRENLDVFDFDLTEDDMRKIAGLDIGHSEIIDFGSPVTERLLMKWKIHD